MKKINLNIEQCENGWMVWKESDNEVMNWVFTSIDEMASWLKVYSGKAPPTPDAWLSASDPELDSGSPYRRANASDIYRQANASEIYP